METKTLIQASAKILRVTELHKGNVVKLVDKEYSSHEIKYGIVLDLLNSGMETYIQLLLFKKSYGEIAGELKLFKGTTDLALFPATIDEVKEDMGEAIERLGESLLKERKTLDDKFLALAKAKEFVTGKLSQDLTEASFETLTIEEFQEEEKLKKIEAIENA